MKSKKLSQITDGAKFKLSKRSKVWYKRISKLKNQVTYTSLSSELSFTRSGSVVVYVEK